MTKSKFSYVGEAIRINEDDDLSVVLPGYKKLEQVWKACRDVVAGEDTVKQAGNLYLPKLKKQDAADYGRYVKRADFFSGGSRTLSAMMGVLFSKAISFGDEENTQNVERLDSLVYNGDVQGFCRLVGEDFLKVGKVGCFVDPGETADNVLAVLYRVEDILWYKTIVSGGKRVLTDLVLREQSSVREGYGSKFDAVTVYKVYTMFGNKCYQADFGIIEDKPMVVLREEFILTAGGKPLDFIPFYMASERGDAFGFEVPSIDGLIKKNLAWYRNSADYEHGLHFVGMPTPWASGVDAKSLKGSELTIGSTTAWLLKDPNAKAGFLEITGDMGALRGALNDKASQMAVLGSRLLDGPKTFAESAETKKQHSFGDSSVLNNASKTLEEFFSVIFSTALRFYARSNSDVVIEAKLHLLDISTELSGKEALDWFSLYLQGGVTFEQYVAVLVRGEALPDNVNVDEMRGELSPEDPQVVETGKDNLQKR